MTTINRINTTTKAPPFVVLVKNVQDETMIDMTIDRGGVSLGGWIEHNALFCTPYLEDEGRRLMKKLFYLISEIGHYLENGIYVTEEYIRDTTEKLDILSYVAYLQRHDVMRPMLVAGGCEASPMFLHVNGEFKGQINFKHKSSHAFSDGLVDEILSACHTHWYAPRVS